MTIKRIQIGENLFAKNDEIAGENAKIFVENQIFSINLMGSPGSGKTAILEKLIPELINNGISCGVIEGDIAGSFDGERIERFGIPVVQINTGGACHLEAHMIRKGIENLPLSGLDMVIVENVGNLVCPAEFKLGVDFNITVASVTEGEEKPVKYPLMYSISELIVLNKVDLLNAVEFRVEKFKEYVRQVNVQAELINVSGKTGENIKILAEYIIKKTKQYEKS
ncbi:MAG: hydrogenase nickel incorporation protein HypB [Candidatus Omnitrophica bacterium]|nr:hydrogenase nickel incorporation protein HypB [Candidatus Omnitrophota bacterium]MCM8828760.1 hydrogenase nickel incorporation protein HypB [Candidatus Omnitrophota bacterium]